MLGTVSYTLFYYYIVYDSIAICKLYHVEYAVVLQVFGFCAQSDKLDQSKFQLPAHPVLARRVVQSLYEIQNVHLKSNIIRVVCDGKQGNTSSL